MKNQKPKEPMKTCLCVHAPVWTIGLIMEQVIATVAVVVVFQQEKK